MFVRTTMLAVAAGAFLASAPASALELTAAHVNPPGEPSYEAFDKLAKAINGAGLDMELKVFPQGQIGGTKDSIEQVIQGALTMTVVSNAHLGSFVPELSVFDIPFLFRDAETHPWIVSDGPIGKQIGDKVKAKIGVDVIAWWSAGMRHMFTKDKPLPTPKEIQGLKVRVMENKLYIDLFNGLGAKATPMPYGELYQSLATGLVDAGENDSSGYRNMKFYEPSPTLTLTGHTFLYKPVIANPDLMAQMNDKQKEFFFAELKKATQFQRDLFANNFESDIEWLKKNAGVKVHDADRDAYREKLQPVIDKYAEQYGKELVEAIINAK